MSSTSDTPERPEQGLPPRPKSGRRPPTIDLAAGETTAAGDTVPTPSERAMPEGLTREDTAPPGARPFPPTAPFRYRFRGRDPGRRDGRCGRQPGRPGRYDRRAAGSAAHTAYAREERGGSGAIKLIAAAVIGGAVAIGGASALISRGVIKSPEVTATSDALQTLGQRVASLENQAASNPGPPATPP